MKRRVFAFFLSVVVFLAALTSCSAAPDENQAALREQWESYLEANEQIQQFMLWAFEYAEQFGQDNSWSSLQRARAACSAVIQALSRMEVPQTLLTEDQYAALIADGIEADVVSVEMDSLETELTYKWNTMIYLMYLLRDDIYLTVSAKKITDWINTEREELRLQGEYLCLTTNYLLLQMDDDSLWDMMGDICPTLVGYQGEWSKDSEQLQIQCDRVLDELEELLDPAAEYVAISDYSLGIVQDAVNTGDLTRLSTAINKMEDVPAYFPLPSWVPQESLWYYMTDDVQSGEMRLITAQEELTGVPSANYFLCSGIDFEEMLAYEERLDYWGHTYYATWNDEMTEYQILTVSGDCKLLISWTEENTTVYQTGAIACLMPELYLAALYAQ